MKDHRTGKLAVSLATLLLTISCALMPVSGNAQCHANGYQFSNIEWDSAYSSYYAATAQIVSLEQTKQPGSRTPEKSCCSKKVAANAFMMSCFISQKPLGKKALPIRPDRWCAEPNVEFVVGFSWVCSA